MSLYKLIVEENKKPTDSASILEALRDLASRLETARHHVRTDDRVRNIDITYGLIQRYFVASEPPLLGHGAGLRYEFENSLRRSQVETPRYEFKQGVINLDNMRSENWNLIDKICEIACSIANIGPQSQGSIFIGVADSRKDATRIQELDKVEPKRIGQTYVVGINRECTLLNLTVESYLTRIVSRIRNSNLSNPLKSDILSNIDCIEYKGMTVIKILIPLQSTIAWVGERTFIREGTETKEASPRQIATITQRFSNSVA